jgi:preprotein translocase subunit SecE
LNRQYKRMMAKEEGSKKKGTPRPNPKAAALAGQKKERTKPRQFLKEVIAELRKVAWPSRQEVVAYSIVVLIATIVIAALIFGMDAVFTEGVLALYDIN